MAQVSQSKVKRWLLHKALAAKEKDLKRFLFSNKMFKLDSLLRPKVFKPVVGPLFHWPESRGSNLGTLVHMKKLVKICYKQYC